MPPSRKSASPSKHSHAARAAALLSKARAQASGSSPTASAPAAKLPNFVATATTPVPLPDLLKQLSSKGGLTMRDAMNVAGKLINARCNTPDALSQISLIALQDMGIESEEQRKRTVLAFKGKKAAGITEDVSSAFQRPRETSNSPRKRRRYDDEFLSREYGNVTGPNDKSNARSARPVPTFDYVFNEILEEESLRGRYAVVNRAPVMTVWATILLERLAFSRAEALSLAHCYVNYTSTMRGVSLRILPASEREKTVNNVGPNQPHFELMGVRIPVMQMQDSTYRGISAGEVVGPEKAFNYMRRSMAQTLSSVFGALTLLADSYMQPTTMPKSGDNDDARASSADNAKLETSSAGTPLDYGADYLNSCGYDLYAEFRPSTSGEWGKKGRLWYEKILALRRGHEDELRAWRIKEQELEGGGPSEEEWSEDVEKLIKELDKEQEGDDKEQEGDDKEQEGDDKEQIKHTEQGKRPTTGVKEDPVKGEEA
ncbi:hypothetical protein ACQY0O_005803 [Thecaphora frezii]